MSEVQIPVTLGELLHVCLGPLVGVLEAEGHPWAPLCRRVLEVYLDGRDDYIAHTYGGKVIESVYVLTEQVADQLIVWAKEIQGELEDFDIWAREMKGNNG